MRAPRPLARAAKRRSVAAFLHLDAGDAQFVDVGAVVVLGIGDRRLERLLDDSGRLLLRETEDVQRLVDRFAANQVGDQPPLLGRQPHTAHRCSRFHRHHPTS